MSTGRSDGPSATSTTSGTGRVTSLNSTMISEACQALSEASNLLRQALSAEGTLPHSIASSAVPPSRSNVERGTVVEDPLRTRHIQSPPLTQSIPSTSTPTSTMRPSRTQAIRDELSRCFRSNTRSRSRHGRSSTSARETVTPSRLLRNRPTWPHIWVALAIVGQDWVPTIKERRELMKAGLGEKKLQMPVNLNGLEVIEYLNDAYPKLENAGGVEICRTSRGSRKLEAITCPAAGYTQHYLSLEAGQAKLYIRPIQRGLDLTPVVDIDEVIDSIENVENAPTEKCSICSADIPYNLIREHFENCSTETIEDIFADEPVDNASDPNEETIDEVTVNEEAAIEEPVNAETINTETINTETINAETINAETINTGQDMMAQEALLPSNSLRTVNEIVQDTIEFSRSNSSDPVEVLRYYQKKVVTGRNIDVESERGISGDKSTNFIIVNRFKLLETSFDEINAIEDLRKTLEVEFYSEVSKVIYLHVCCHTQLYDHHFTFQY
ncbi:uncharacterized protein [Ptychodera flava]|uniref:uncharacterized protein isoform X2 n=1 Tax=Ptychodera flava TaxID=63121 RepID=UPI00396AAA4B